MPIQNLRDIVKELKNYIGLTRKKTIADVVHGIPQVSKLISGAEVLADFGEDAAVLSIPSKTQNEDVLLIAADGIMSALMNADLTWAGYCSVLVNLHDIAAMGAVSLALVDVLSVKDKNALTQITMGMSEACLKFGVPIVGGHIHPDSEFNAVDVAILGVARRSDVIYSHTARVGDSIIFAMDLDGQVHPKSKYAWDTTSHKPAGVVRKQLMIMSALGAANLVHAGKDISNPGTLGTLGMLLESSKKGAVVDLSSIPYPADQKLAFPHWLQMYQGCGFVLTCKPDNAKSVIDRVNSVGLTGKIAGEIIEEPRLIIEQNDKTEILFDFTHDSITGI